MQPQGRNNGYLPASAFQRTERIVCDDNGYYFRSREETLVGPFATEAETHFESKLFIEIKRIEQEFATLNRFTSYHSKYKQQQQKY